MNSVKAKLLLVDDDPDLLRLLSIRLQGAGYAVTAVESAEAALSQVSVSCPDVVITDLRMGGMDGMALFESLQKKHPALPVVILTAHGTIPDAVAATQRGVFGYLTKPFEGKALIDQVEKALQFGGTPAANGITDTSWRADIITRSPEMEAILAKARLVAGSDASVMIFGESGAGKEMLARAIHKASARAGQPFVAVNCGAIPEQLLESELFGHVKGAFTGAASDYKGLFQAAGRGTVIAVRKLPGVGTVLVDRSGKTLYSPQQEASGKIACTGGCLSFWFPVRVAAGTALRAPSGVTGVLGMVHRPGGMTQLTYDGRPLYTFRLDQAPGQVHGNNFTDHFAGTTFTWHALTTSGAPAGTGGQRGNPGGYSYQSSTPGY